MTETKRIQPITRQTAVCLIGGLAAASLLTVVLGFMAEKALNQGWLVPIDRSVLFMIHGYLRSPLMDKIMLLITFLGSYKFYLFVTPFLVFLLLKLGHRRETTILLVCLLGGSILNNLLKLGFKRIRPEEFFLVLEKGYSFPSGHAMIAVPFYGYLAYLYWRIRRKNAILLIVLTIGLVVGIGFSRIYLGVHWFSDVAAGYFCGSIWLFSCLAALEVSHYLKPPIKKR